MLTCNMYFDSIVHFPLESRRSVHPFHHNDALPYKSQMANNKCQTYNGPIRNQFTEIREILKMTIYNCSTITELKMNISIFINLFNE